jgi:hypothetical protein
MSPTSRFRDCEYVKVQWIGDSGRRENWQVTGFPGPLDSPSESFITWDDVRSDLSPWFMMASSKQTAFAETSRTYHRSKIDDINYSNGHKLPKNREPSTDPRKQFLSQASTVWLRRGTSEEYKTANPAKLNPKYPIKLTATVDGTTESYCVDGWGQTKNLIAPLFVRKSSLQPLLYYDQDCRLSADEEYRESTDTSAPPTKRTRAPKRKTATGPPTAESSKRGAGWTTVNDKRA